MVIEKSKYWGLFWSYQLNSTANSAYSPRKCKGRNNLRIFSFCSIIQWKCQITILNFFEKLRILICHIFSRMEKLSEIKPPLPINKRYFKLMHTLIQNLDFKIFCFFSDVLHVFFLTNWLDFCPHWLFALVKSKDTMYNQGLKCKTARLSFTYKPQINDILQGKQ